jgi:hypothetical protein
MSARESKRRWVKDWTSINGAQAEVVQHGQTVMTGTIDGVTNDGTIVWIQDHTGRRKLYERCEAFEVWVPQQDIGLNYRISKS